MADIIQKTTEYRIKQIGEEEYKKKYEENGLSHFYISKKGGV